LKSYLAVVLAATILAATPLTAQDLVPAMEVEQRGERLAVIEDEEGNRLRGSDYFASPQSEERDMLRREAVTQRLAKQQGARAGKTHEVARGQYLEFPVDRTDRIFVLLVEYGDGVTTLPNGSFLPATSGPRHNQIPQPDRSVNNTTIWQADYSREHYVDMYFNQMVEYYKSQSSGRYTFNGDVTHWVKVPFNGYRYGSNNAAVSDVGTWTLIADGINLWVKAQLASGQTLEQVKAYLQTFDVWDRYDHDHDGNFDEADGYIDHFQIVHAGDGEETGGGTLGSSAIWSHRWFAFYNYRTILGPAYNRYGGLEFGGGFGANPSGLTSTSYGTIGSTRSTVTNAHPYNPTGIWVGDYTIQPENGGLGVFAHEYGHDLGLPDHYDTAGGANGTGYWTIMSSGSYLGPGHTDIGSRPGDMSAWDKLQLGWLAYEEAFVGAKSTHKLGPAENTTKKAQAVVISLPPSQNFTFEFDPLAAAAANGKAWYSGTGNNWDATMIRSIDVPAVSPVLSMRLSFAMESAWDYGYVSVSADNGATWSNLPSTGLTTNANPNGPNLGNGFTGTTSGAWITRTFDLTAWAGQTVQLRIRYLTDAFTFLSGLVVDDITIGSFVDTADSSSGWTLTRFASSNGKRITNNPHYYIAEFRQYRGYDTGLQTGPYGGSLLGKPNWYSHYPYQDGLLITYADTDWTNNNTSVHRGEGFALPIDARPAVLTRTGLVETATGFAWNFSPWSSSVQTHDATFGLEPTDAFTISFTGNLGAGGGYPARQAQFDVPISSKPAERLFNDMNSYWTPAKPDASVITPQTGTTIRVINTSAQGSFMQIHVNH
jgi:immune inhibitor A